MCGTRGSWIDYVHLVESLAAKQGIQFDEQEIVQKMANDFGSQPGDPPEMSFKLDAVNRMIAQFLVLSQKPRSPHNPESEKRKGDVFDLDLLFAVPLPAVIVTADETFVNRLKGTNAPDAQQVCLISDFHRHLREGKLPSLVRRRQTPENQFSQRQEYAYRLWESRGGPLYDNWRDWFDAEPIS